jgi:hypothetical protein
VLLVEWLFLVLLQLLDRLLLLIFIFCFNVVLQRFLTFDSTYTITLETKCFTFRKARQQMVPVFYFFRNEHDIQIPL